MEFSRNLNCIIEKSDLENSGQDTFFFFTDIFMINNSGRNVTFKTCPCDVKGLISTKNTFMKVTLQKWYVIAYR